MEKEVKKTFFKKGLAVIAIAAGVAIYSPNVQAASYTDFNQASIVSPISAQLGGYLMQLNSYDQAFQNMDSYMMLSKKERRAIKHKTKKSTEPVVTNSEEIISDYSHDSLWTRAVGSFETVPIHNGPNVRNNIWGTYIGGETGVKDLGNGWDGMWGAFVGYNGSYQSFAQNTVWQNGGNIGLVGMAFKDNFFAGGTINVGGYGGHDNNTKYGNENFALLTTGIAAKTGYNWEFADGKFIIQPALQVSYSFIYSFDNWTSNELPVDTDPIHALQVEPSIKFIGNLKNHWQPYIGVSFVYNILDKAHATVDNVSLPNFSINPYVRYGVGVRKAWGDRVSGLLQVHFMSGGRNGIGILGGLRWALGKDGSYEVNKNAQLPEMKQTTISLNSIK